MSPSQKASRALARGTNGNPGEGFAMLMRIQLLPPHRDRHRPSGVARSRKPTRQRTHERMISSI